MCQHSRRILQRRKSFFEKFFQQSFYFTVKKRIRQKGCDVSRDRKCTGRAQCANTAQCANKDSTMCRFSQTDYIQTQPPAAASKWTVQSILLLHGTTTIMISTKLCVFPMKSNYATFAIDTHNRLRAYCKGRFRRKLVSLRADQMGDDRNIMTFIAPCNKATCSAAHARSSGSQDLKVSFQEGLFNVSIGSSTRNFGKRTLRETSTEPKQRAFRNETIYRKFRKS